MFTNQDCVRVGGLTSNYGNNPLFLERIRLSKLVKQGKKMQIKLSQSSNNRRINKVTYKKKKHITDTFNGDIQILLSHIGVNNSFAKNFLPVQPANVNIAPIIIAEHVLPKLLIKFIDFLFNTSKVIIKPPTENVKMDWSRFIIKKAFLLQGD